jgi:hypothetical protein
MKNKILFLVMTIFLISLVGCSDISPYDRDFLSYNDAYKKVLYATGQGNNNSGQLMDNLKVEWEDFYEYKDNMNKNFDSEETWKETFDSINGLIKSADVLIQEDNLSAAHEELEEVRAEWNHLLEENNVENRHYYMVKFHDIMEEAYEKAVADEKPSIQEECDMMETVWKSLENENQFIDNNTDYEMMWKKQYANINRICYVSEDREIEAGMLKKGFVEIYMKYG